MAELKEFYYPSRDEKRTPIHAAKWIPTVSIRGILIIAHGMSEHILRYDELATFMAAQGFVVAGNDHLGHGKTAAEESDFGYFCERDGDVVVVRDVHRLKKMIQEEYPGVPVFVLGHSMGSFIMRNYIYKYGKGINGALFLGTGKINSMSLKLGRLYLKLYAPFVGWKTTAVGIKLPTADYGARIENPVSKSDWLTSRRSAVEAFDNDPLNDHSFTLNGYDVLAKLIINAQDKKNLAKIPKDLPVYFMSGTEDPLGEYGKGIPVIRDSYVAAGLTDVGMKLYEGDRHEIWNEKDRFQVFEDILKWMEARL